MTDAEPTVEPAADTTVDHYPIRILAPAKLTRSLRITGVRPDGLHLIEAEMVGVDLCDVIELAPGAEGLTLVGAGDDVPTGEDNLVNRALALAGVQAAVRLTKYIPSQAGLGGGSSDAGAILAWAGFDDRQRAAALGADVAFCSVGGRARVSGFGEVVEPLPPIEAVFTLLTPPVACPTGAVYQRWDDLGGPTGDHGNDLEPAALAVAPELARWRDELGDATGSRPQLAGSGSTWFVEGAFPGRGRMVCATVDRPFLPG